MLPAHALLGRVHATATLTAAAEILAAVGRLFDDAHRQIDIDVTPEIERLHELVAETIDTSRRVLQVISAQMDVEDDQAASE